MKQILFISILTFSLFPLFSQNIIGNWKGNIDVNGNKIPIVFHFYKDSTGKIDGKWDSPSQNAKNLPCSGITVTADSIIISLKVISGFYNGKFITPDSIAGMWHQGGGQLALNISKNKEEAIFLPPKRPQTPKPPFSYQSEDVEYTNADKSITFGATLTLPDVIKKNKRFPAVIMITGSGKQDRDETLFDHKPFAVIADYLTKSGIAVLRVDDRGMGKTTGVFDTSTSADFAKDVEAGIQYLLSRKEIDKKHIGLIGHSEGGMIAPMVAVKVKNVSFIVMLAGPGVPGWVIINFQIAQPKRKAGINDSDIQKSLALTNTVFNYEDSTISPVNFRDKISAIYFDWKKKQTLETLAAIIKSSDDEEISQLQESYSISHSPWFHFFLKYDPTKGLEKLDIPVLALNGEKDIQVDPKTNLPAIEAALKKSKSKDFKVIELPGLNHLFQHCKNCTSGEYGELEETFAPEALKIIGDWITKVVEK